MTSEQGSVTDIKTDVGLSIDTDTSKARRSQPSAYDEVSFGDETGSRTRASVGSERLPSQVWFDIMGEEAEAGGHIEASSAHKPLSPKKPRRRLTESDTRQGPITGNGAVQQLLQHHRAAKGDTAQRPSALSTPRAAPPSSTTLSRSSSSANGRGNGNDDDDDSSWSWSPRRRPSSRAGPRTLGPRSWIVACTRINDRIADDLSRLCALKGQVEELLYLSSQLVPSTRRWGKWIPSSSKWKRNTDAGTAQTEAGEIEEDFDPVYYENLGRLAAEPDVLVSALRNLQKALGTTMPASRRISVDMSPLASPRVTGSRSGSRGSVGTGVELERLRKQWATLSKRVISLSSHLDKIVRAAVEACRKSGAHPERPQLVARLKELVAAAQPGTMYEEYEGVTLKQVVGQVYPQGRPEPEVSSDNGSWKRRKNPVGLMTTAAAKVLRAVPVPPLVLKTTGMIVRGLKVTTGTVFEQLAWIPRTLFLSRALVYLRIYLVSIMVALPLSFYYFKPPPDIWV
ncbi:hypothetical protein PGQ11_011633 [Apiospora arundinis]|uniref:Uncharacterized protein n=1 Tax=Apiospora arundinis TaxID=335852 RepID=A0ABR2I0Q8_9PEZI